MTEWVPLLVGPLFIFYTICGMFYLMCRGADILMGRDMKFKLWELLFLPAIIAGLIFMVLFAIGMEVYERFPDTTIWTWRQKE